MTFEPSQVPLGYAQLMVWRMAICALLVGAGQYTPIRDSV
jgi:hypothetical protein